ncbi:MAG: fibronectin type III domain-containing protein, partial [Desulfuromonadaceae bacterium]|nr:fibronectin type III domain-containing protein [Desulfuromonadaceae bacterium]
TLDAVPSPTVPAVPSGVSAAGGSNQVTLSWAAVAGASSYNVYWSATPGVTITNGSKISGITSPFVKTGLSAGTAYYFIVTSANSVGESAASPQVKATTNAAPPAVTAAPTGISATGGANQVSLSWTAVSGASAYNIYWSTASGVTTTTGTKITSANNSYVQTGLAAGTTYYYIVTAVNSAGESPASVRATATTNAPVAKQQTLSWDPVSGATSYNLYWSTVSGVTPANGTKISGISSTTYTHTGLTAGTTYYYVVTAVNSTSESAASAQASGTTSL